MDIRECCFRTIPEKGKRLVWEITHTCHFGCDYCFQEKKRKLNPTRTLNEKDLIKICNNIKELSISDVLITGGEIFHISDIIDVVCNELKKLNISISFSTACFSENNFINKLFSHNPRSLNISLDPAMNNNEKAYNKGLDAVNHLLSLSDLNNVEVKITGVIHNLNYLNYKNYINDINELCNNHTSLSAIYITNPYEIGYIKPNIRVDKKNQKEILCQTKGVNSSKIKLVNFPLLNNVLQKCPAASGIVHLEPTGTIYPCHLFANFSHDNYYQIGNILNDDLSIISDNLNRFSRQIDYAIEEYKNLNSKCNICKTKTRCGGGCIAEIISAGNMIEPQLFCKKNPHSNKNTHKISFNRHMQLFENSILDITKTEEEKIKEYILSHIRKKQHDLAHGYDHVLNVVNIARHIAKKENANLRIVTAAAYFHDFSPRHKLIFQGHTKLSANLAVKFLKNIGFNDIDLEKIYNCIDTSSYGSSELGHVPQSIEAKIVRDADWLDAIGARGIARVFAFAAAHHCETLGEVEWDTDNPPKKTMSLVGPDPSPIYHFFSKLLWIKDKICTNTGKKMAEKRHVIMVKFLKDYKYEMQMLK
ncbi:MAG: HD domain-containing protein [Firmicutes bacterium]|nr:HD domain-containing protein [Bacillota bacterium]